MPNYASEIANKTAVLFAADIYLVYAKSQKFEGVRSQLLKDSYLKSHQTLQLCNERIRTLFNVFNFR